MPADIRTIRNFKDLVRYLEDELDWPLQGCEPEDLTFDYDPAEVGLKDEDAAKVRKILQLRPLETGQPWGIFLVEFQKQKLPVGILRRILSHLVIKKRASATKADAKRWHASDILFISAFGNEDPDGGREIAFAHFHTEPDTDDMPTLRVLGWDGSDTPLKLHHVTRELATKLHWPANTADQAAWRKQWSGAFRHGIAHTIRTAGDLAQTLAALARQIRDLCSTMMRAESERGPITKLHKAFQAALIHDLTKDDFADTYAQTITYGLLTAAISRTDTTTTGGGGTAIIAENINDMVPVTNPFLKEMLQEFLRIGGRKNGINFDELGVQDVVELLRDEKTDLPAILRDFGNKTAGEDPVIHFYEHFLSAYNKKLKIQRGVFYTPKPVVSYIVRSVHELLQTEFGLADGLADTTTWGEMVARTARTAHPIKLPPLTDEPGETRTIPETEPFVQILDPATGTATFLVEVIDVIYRTLCEKWKQQKLTPAQQEVTWNDYVPKHLLPRLHAYELMMAPYAIAHMKIGLKLLETGYKFTTNERARIYLTNALEPKVKQLPAIGFEPLANEAKAVNEIKWYKRFTVVIGNPPYSGISSNMSDHAQHMVDAYKFVDGVPLNEKKLWLQDDYVKFIRKAQTIIELTQSGIFGYITNHGYFENPTFRGMRHSLLKTFTKLSIVDLHGNLNKKEKCPDGSEDVNVFDIRQGVGICLAAHGKSDSLIQHTELWGRREIKNNWLAQQTISKSIFNKITPESPYYFLKPHSMESRDEYDGGWRIPDIFPLNTVGFVTARDSLTIQHSDREIWKIVQRFISLGEEQARLEFNLGKDARDWRIITAQEDVRRSGPTKKFIQKILYRPFDTRFTYYTGNSRGFYASPCGNVMRHMITGSNLSLCFNRREELAVGYSHFLATRLMTEHGLLSSKTTDSQAPLYLFIKDNEERQLFAENCKRANLSNAFLAALSQKLNLRQQGDFGLPSGITPEDIFHYIYAVFHSPGYRSRYAEFLKIDFPRLPLTGSLKLFRALASLGGELVSLHLLESPKLDKPITKYIGKQTPEVEKISWSENTVWLDKAQTAGFEGVREDVWNFHIGGYQVCEKWLKDRKNRALSAEDIAHYHKIIIALTETIRLMSEIDRLIETHGGWPGAFQTDK